jgi:ABC-type antimicrobial peptide transport system permease subunit
VIRLQGLHKSYRTGKNRLHVLKGLDLTIETGELASIMGASGSGKSTLLNVLGILDSYDEGSYRLDGTLMSGLSEAQAAMYRNRYIGFVFQSFNLLPFKTAVENVALPLYYRGIPRRKRHRAAMEVLERMGLAERATHLPAELSGGQQQLAPGRDRLSLLGEQLTIGGLPHRVIGIFEDEGGEEERRRIYVPITTAQTAWGGRNRVNRIMFTVGDATEERSKQMADEARQMLAARYRFDPKDPNALRVRNNLEQFRKITAVLDGIGLFVWIIGLGTIVAGVAAVSNIMLISVKERTKEIGVRKALGATPRSIVMMILSEALLLTGVAGYLGLVGGIAVLELARELMPPSDYFRDPHVNLQVAIAATVILVIAGGLAGFFPARRAAAVQPVVALRDE